jgi:cytochrome c oxidase assembly protein subunit 15
METAVRRLAVVATIGMFLVLMMGSSVTNTGSSEGCGKSWPLCHGEFIPEYAFETAVEYSHRLVTAVEGLLIAATAAGALYLGRGRQRREVKVLVALTVGTLLLQSGLGASAVMWPQSPAIMATHFGISLVCFASIFLLTRRLFRGGAGGTGGTERVVSSCAPSPSAPPPLRWAAWVALVGVVGVAYLGAYMRHSNAEMACYEWPRCTESAVLPTLSGPEGIAVAHRLSAAAAWVLIAGLAWATHRHRADLPDVARAYAFALLFVSLQAAAGAAVVLTRLDLWSTLAHAALMALLFVALADAARLVLPTRERAPAPQPLLAAAGTAD